MAGYLLGINNLPKMPWVWGTQLKATEELLRKAGDGVAQLSPRPSTHFSGLLETAERRGQSGEGGTGGLAWLSTLLSEL